MIIAAVIWTLVTFVWTINAITFKDTFALYLATSSLGVMTVFWLRALGVI